MVLYQKHPHLTIRPLLLNFAHGPKFMDIFRQLFSHIFNVCWQLDLINNICIYL